MTELPRPDQVANRAYSNTHRTDDLERLSEPSRRNTASLVVPWVVANVEPGGRLLDVAGGAGAYASRIARETQITIDGLDISEELVALRDADPLLGENVVGDMEALPFADGTYDAVMFVAALHHVPDPLPALREAARALRPGGQLFAFEPASLRGRASSPVPGHAHEFRLPRSWLLQRARDAGFTIVEARGRRIVMRALRRVATPTARMWSISDAADHVLGAIPLVHRFGEVVMVRGVARLGAGSGG